MVGEDGGDKVREVTAQGGYRGGPYGALGDTERALSFTLSEMEHCKALSRAGT